MFHPLGTSDHHASDKRISSGYQVGILSQMSVKHPKSVFTRSQEDMTKTHSYVESSSRYTVFDQAICDPSTDPFRQSLMMAFRETVPGSRKLAVESWKRYWMR